MDRRLATLAAASLGIALDFGGPRQLGFDAPPKGSIKYVTTPEPLTKRQRRRLRARAATEGRE